MPRVDLTARLARESRPGAKDAIKYALFLTIAYTASSSPGMARWSLPRPAAAFATCSRESARATIPHRIGPEDVAAWFDSASRDKPGAANRALEIPRAMMFGAEECGLRERGTNPCLGIAKNPRKQVARFLDANDLARLGRALDASDAHWPEAVAAIRLQAFTRCRSEVLNLRRRNIGADALNLDDSKTGMRLVPLGGAARALIAH